VKNTLKRDKTLVEKTHFSHWVGMSPPRRTDYSPFGVLLPERTSSTAFYRLGFQGQEHDDEVKGEGNSVNFKYRMHDPRVGRFFAVDPLAGKYPHNGPYNFSENRVIDGVELEGLEWENVKDENGKVSEIKVTANYTVGGAESNNLDLESYKTEMQEQFNKTIFMSSYLATGIGIKGTLNFDNSVKESELDVIVPVVSFDADPAICIGPYEQGGFTPFHIADVNTVSSSGIIHSASDVGQTGVHELLHTLRFPDVFHQAPVSEDARLEWVSTNVWNTTETTDINYSQNIFLYGFYSLNQELPRETAYKLITPGELNFLIKEIDAQMMGAGYFNRNRYYTKED
jgi:RHS repeat-associated protein